MPRSLADLIGVDYFGHVIAAGLSPRATDATIVQVGRLTRPQRLGLSPSSLSDAGLMHLKGTLDLRDTQVTDAGLAHLKGLTNLTYLTLSQIKISDAGLAHLKGMTKLSV